MTNDLVHVLLDAPVPRSALSLADFAPSIVAALVGALAGAGTAWWIQARLARIQRQREDNKEKQRVLDTRYDAGNRALFALFCQTNAMLDLKKQIQPYADHPQRWMYVPVLAHDYGNTPSMDLASLTFMLNSEFCPNVLRDLYFAQQSFRHAAYVLQNRNRLRNEITEQALAKAVSQLTEKELQTFTDALFDAVPRAYEKLKAMQPLVIECLKKLGHGVEPMSFVMIEEAQNNAMESDKE